GRIPDAELEKAIRKNIDLTPKGIMKRLNLLRPIYRQTAAYGHFGREEDGFTWEKLDLVKMLQRAIR
ncbi:MAG: methionine adenosyltransferase domain-containing protein, partial [Bacteroidota bacterium]